MSRYFETPLSLVIILFHQRSLVIKLEQPSAATTAAWHAIRRAIAPTMYFAFHQAAGRLSMNLLK